MSGFTGRRGVSQAELQQYQSSIPNMKDAIFAPLYDYQTYPAAGALSFNFFSVPQGQGVTSAPGGAGVKTFLDTNMQVPNTLPLGNTFLVIGIEVEYWPTLTPGRAGVAAAAATMGSNWNDVYSVLRNGALTFQVQNRNYVQDGPLMKFPTSTRLSGVAAYSETTATTFGQFDYASSCGASYDITPVRLNATQAFTIVVNFPALIPTVSTNTGRIGVRLVGKLIRDAQ